MRIDRRQEGPRMRQYKKRQRGKALKIAIVGTGIVAAAFLSFGIYRIFFLQKKQPSDNSVIEISADNQQPDVSVEAAPSSDGDHDLSAAAGTGSDLALSSATTETAVSAGEETDGTTGVTGTEANVMQTDEPAYVSRTDAAQENESGSDVLADQPKYLEDSDFMKRIEDMTLKKKICALIVTRPQTFDDNISENGMTTAIDDSVKQNLNNNPACGLMMNEKNISYTQQLQGMVSEAEAFGRNELTFPLLIMMYGKDKRAWEDALRYNLEAYWKNEGIYRNVYELSLVEILKQYGFNLYCVENLEEAEQEIRDCEVNSMLACIVFPDKQEADSALFLKEFDDVLASISSGVEMIMVPANLLTDENTDTMNDYVESSIPNRENENIVEEIRIREGMGDVIIMTDTMDFSSWDASSGVSALKAGADVIVTDEFEGTVNAIQEAVKRGDLAEDRINEALYRVFKAKQ